MGSSTVLRSATENRSSLPTSANSEALVTPAEEVVPSGAADAAIVRANAARTAGMRAIRLRLRTRVILFPFLSLGGVSALISAMSIRERTGRRNFRKERIPGWSRKRFLADGAASCSYPVVGQACELAPARRRGQLPSYLVLAAEVRSALAESVRARSAMRQAVVPPRVRRGLNL